MNRAILPIVEGHSEIPAIPVLLRRLLARVDRSDIAVAPPFRVGRHRILCTGELERALIQGVRSRRGTVAVLVVLDADDDDPARLETTLLERCRATTPLPAAVVAATREFEAWFLGSKDSLRGVRGIREDARAPEHPESIRGAKQRLTSNMVGRRKYLERDDAPAFAAQMDLDLAIRRCASFRRLTACLEEILQQVPRHGAS